MLTNYRDNLGILHEAIQVSWDTIAATLGHEHEGTAEDDAALVAWLLDSGCPAWVVGAEGWTDGFGWGLIGPVIAED